MYEKYRELRDLHGFKDAKVSKDTGISPASLSEWKNGKSELSYPNVLKLAKYFNVDANYFYGNEKTPEHNALIQHLISNLDGATRDDIIFLIETYKRIHKEETKNEEYIDLNKVEHKGSANYPILNNGELEDEKRAEAIFNQKKEMEELKRQVSQERKKRKEK